MIAPLSHCLTKRRSTVRATLARGMLVALAGVLTVSGLAVLSATPIVPAPAAEAAAPTRTVGGGPLDDIVAVATRYARTDCGLSANRLAGMLLVPTFQETGAPKSAAPAPMTLSRWDTQTALWAFGDKNTKYQQAFFHPGIGMWQFDSAGGWPLHAGTAINTLTAAETAASWMSSAFCAKKAESIEARSRYAWFPWYYCQSGTVCFDILNEVFDGTNLTVLRDNSVTRLGGAVVRDCAIQGIGKVACTYVDPAKAEGYKGFASTSTAIPTPISKPFYVFLANNREYRYWLRQDTGYDATIVASKPLTANARTSLTWSTVESAGGALCDQTTGRGACAPFGSVDTVTSGVRSIISTGWAIDPETAAATHVHLYVDGLGARDEVADDPRPDVGSAHPTYGSSHGFAVTLPNITPGDHSICHFAIDSTPPILGHTLMDCRMVHVFGGSPLGSVDTWTPKTNAVSITGWTFDPDTYDPNSVQVTVDGVARATAPATGAHPSVASVYPAWGKDRSFNVTVNGITAGSRNICVVANNIGTGANATLGCRTLNISDGTPVGIVDTWAVTWNQVTVGGWTIDPDTTATVQVEAWVDGVRKVAQPADANSSAAAAAYSAWGPNHGFSIPLTGLSGGMHNICVVGVNQGAGGNASLGCQTLNVPAVAPHDNPIGSIDEWLGSYGQVQVKGWMFDPNAFTPIEVHVYVDGVGVGAMANKSRPDVGAVYPPWGPNHGFDVTVKNLSAGSHGVCVFGINVGAGGNVLFECRQVNVPSPSGDNSPMGYVDVWSGGAGKVAVQGWTLDPDTFGPNNVAVYVDWVVLANVPANLNRSDIAAAFPLWGPNHGYNVSVSGLTPGVHDVCVAGVNVGPGANRLFDCRKITVS